MLIIINVLRNKAILSGLLLTDIYCIDQWHPRIGSAYFRTLNREHLDDNIISLVFKVLYLKPRSFNLVSAQKHVFVQQGQSRSLW